MAAAPAGAPPPLPLGTLSLLRVGKGGVGWHGEKRSAAESRLGVGCGCPSGGVCCLCLQRSSPQHQEFVSTVLASCGSESNGKAKLLSRHRSKKWLVLNNPK